MQPYNLMDLLLPFQIVTKEVVLYLPRTSDLRQLIKFEHTSNKLPVIHYCMEGASKVRQPIIFILSMNQQSIGIVCILRQSFHQYLRRGYPNYACPLNDENGNTRSCVSTRKGSCYHVLTKYGLSSALIDKVSKGATSVNLGRNCGS